MFTRELTHNLAHDADQQSTKKGKVRGRRLEKKNQLKDDCKR